MIPARRGPGQIVQHNCYWGSFGNVNNMTIYHAKQIMNDDHTGHLQLCAVAIPSSVEDAPKIKAKLNEDGSGFLLTTPLKHAFFQKKYMVIEAFEKTVSKSEGLGMAILENERVEEKLETQTQEFLFPGQTFYGNNRNFNANAKDPFELKPRPLGLRMMSKTYNLPYGFVNLFCFYFRFKWIIKSKFTYYTIGMNPKTKTKYSYFYV